MRYKFPKEKKLKNTKAIEALFHNGKAVTKFPIKVIYRVAEVNTTQVAFTVPKRLFRFAVERNRLKRQMREVYRLNQNLLAQKNIHFHILFIYISKRKESYEIIEKKMKRLLEEIIRTTTHNN